MEIRCALQHINCRANPYNEIRLNLIANRFLMAYTLNLIFDILKFSLCSYPRYANLNFKKMLCELIMKYTDDV